MCCCGSASKVPVQRHEGEHRESLAAPKIGARLPKGSWCPPALSHDLAGVEDSFASCGTHSRSLATDIGCKRSNRARRFVELRSGRGTNAVSHRGSPYGRDDRHCDAVSASVTWAAATLVDMTNDFWLCVARRPTPARLRVWVVLAASHAASAYCKRSDAAALVVSAPRNAR